MTGSFDLLTSVFESLNCVTKQFDTAEESSSIVQLDQATVFLAVNLLVIPHGDGDGVLGAEQQVVVDVPLWVQGVLARLSGVTLTYNGRNSKD